MRWEVLSSSASRRRVEHALRHAVLVVAVGVAIAVALVSVNSLFVFGVLAAGAAAVAGLRAYEANEVRADFRATFPEAWNAVIVALLANGRSVGEPTWYSATEGVVHADGATVIVERHPRGVVRVRARLGAFATEDRRRRAALIVEHVASRLA